MRDASHAEAPLAPLRCRERSSDRRWAQSTSAPMCAARTPRRPVPLSATVLLSRPIDRTIDRSALEACRCAAFEKQRRRPPVGDPTRATPRARRHEASLLQVSPVIPTTAQARSSPPCLAWSGWLLRSIALLALTRVLEAVRSSPELVDAGTSAGWLHTASIFRRMCRSSGRWYAVGTTSPPSSPSARSRKLVASSTARPTPPPPPSPRPIPSLLALSFSTAHGVCLPACRLLRVRECARACVRLNVRALVRGALRARASIGAGYWCRECAE